MRHTFDIVCTICDMSASELHKIYMHGIHRNSYGTCTMAMTNSNIQHL